MTNIRHRPEQNWLICARVAGVIALLCYFAVPVFHLPPWGVGRWIFFLIGPAIALATFALLQACKYRDDDIARSIGLGSVIVAGLFMHLMAVIQDGNFTTMRRRLSSAEDALHKQIEESVLWGVNNVQLSLDICFDIWIAGGAAFLAASLLPKHRQRWIGIIGLAVVAFTLGMNVWKYPAPPAEVGGIDGGPYLAAWLGIYLWFETRFKPS